MQFPIFGSSHPGSIEKKTGNLFMILRLSPLLLLYCFIVLAVSNNTFQGDEGRYVMFAENLLKGYYSPQNDIYLWNGPGYPIVLMPFVMLKLPWLTAKLLNPLFLFVAVIYFYFTLRLYISDRAALFFSYVLGLYYPICRYIYMLLTEQLTIFLVCGFIFHFCKLHIDRDKSRSHILISSFYLGFLALTKIFFGYVIFSGLLIFLILYVQHRKIELRRTFLVFLFSFLLCVPYLSYTYSLTGKMFYWGNSGGLALYLMSTPYEEELGDWFERNSIHHQNDYKEFEGLSNIELDNAFKKRAMRNIYNYPVKYLKNIIANIGRLWFNYPFSYQSHSLSTFFYMIPGMFIFVLCVLCIYPTYRGRESIPFEIYVLMLVALISFGGLLPSNGENRYLWPIIPLLLLWVSFVTTRIVKIQIRKE